MVEIEGFDTCPCGGTHVDSPGEVGRVVITDGHPKGADTQRVEFRLEDP